MGGEREGGREGDKSIPYDPLPMSVRIREKMICSRNTQGELFFFSFPSSSFLLKAHTSVSAELLLLLLFAAE